MKATRVKNLKLKCQKYDSVLTSEKSMLSGHLRQIRHSQWRCSTINQLVFLIGTRVCMFQSLKHFRCTLTLASWVLSQADPCLPKLSGVPFVLVLFFILLSLSSSLLLSPALSVSLLGMFVQLVSGPSLEYHVCCWAVLRAPLLIPFVNAHSRDVCLSGFFFKSFPG